MPGVYFFKDVSGQILYVGKAKSLRLRVKSYFQPPEALGPKTAQLVKSINRIDYIEVGSELEAILLESRFIKKFKPHYNLISKDDKSPYYIHITTETYPRPVITHQVTGSIAGPFLNRLIPSRILRQFRPVAPFCLAPRPVKRPCLYAHLGLCSPCPATGDTTGYQKNIARLRHLLHGNFSRVKSGLVKLMKESSHNQNFEQAALLRDQLTSLDHLLSTPVSPEEYIQNPNLVQDLRQRSLDSLTSLLGLSTLNRIEFYDNAHLAGTQATGAMVVAKAGQITPREYRHFTIKKSHGNDVEMMREVLTRRLKRGDWPTPNLIVLDGGKPQLSVVTWSIPTIALAKKEEIIYTRTTQYKLPKDHPGLNLLMRLRDEAHRFSRRLHHKHRSNLLR